MYQTRKCTWHDDSDIPKMRCRQRMVTHAHLGMNVLCTFSYARCYKCVTIDVIIARLCLLTNTHTFRCTCTHDYSNLHTNHSHAHTHRMDSCTGSVYRSVWVSQRNASLLGCVRNLSTKYSSFSMKKKKNWLPRNNHIKFTTQKSVAYTHCILKCGFQIEHFYINTN